MVISYCSKPPPPESLSALTSSSPVPLTDSIAHDLRVMSLESDCTLLPPYRPWSLDPLLATALQIQPHKQLVPMTFDKRMPPSHEATGELGGITSTVAL